MKYIKLTFIATISLFVSANSIAAESSEQQSSQIQTTNTLTKEQKHQSRQLFLQQQKRIRDDQNKFLRTQHAEKHLKK